MVPFYCNADSSRQKDSTYFIFLIFKEGLQHSRCSISAGEFYIHLTWSSDEKLGDMHSALRNLLFPPSHFLISSQKEDEQRKSKEQEGQRNANEHGPNGGGGGGKAQVREPLMSSPEQAHLVDNRAPHSL